MEAWSGNEKQRDNEKKRKEKGMEWCERHGTQRRKERLSGDYRNKRREYGFLF